MSVKVACVDVGQGDCTIAVDEATGESILIDCRAGKHEEACAELARLGSIQLCAAIVSHSQFDHFGGVIDVLETLGDHFTGELYFNHDSLLAVPVAGEDRKVAGRKLRALLHRAREFGDRVSRADACVAPGSVGSLRWELLAPTYAEILAAVEKANPNLASCVVLLQVGEDVFVVGGDAHLTTWERIADEVPKGSIVRWPHHGGSLSEEADADLRVLRILEPTWVIVSVGAGNRYGHPTEAFFSAVASHPAQLVCTQATSACVAGRGRGGVCAGTIRVHLGGADDPRVVPDSPDHAAVIASFGNGRCLPARQR